MLIVFRYPDVTRTLSLMAGPVTRMNRIYAILLAVLVGLMIGLSVLYSSAQLRAGQPLDIHTRFERKCHGTLQDIQTRTYLPAGVYPTLIEDRHIELFQFDEGINYNVSGRYSREVLMKITESLIGG